RQVGDGFGDLIFGAKFGDISPNVGDKLFDHGNPAPNNPVWQPYRERFCWGKVRADVEQWCKSCDACSARKGPKIRSRGKLHRYNVGAPFQRIAFDILGPLPR
ncbi:retrovirus-related Pol polyprotein from transposon 412, partial [Trichonephila clavipes]